MPPIGDPVDAKDIAIARLLKNCVEQLDVSYCFEGQQGPTNIVTDDGQSRRQDQTGGHANQDSLAQDELVVFSAKTCEHHGYD